MARKGQLAWERHEAVQGWGGTRAFTRSLTTGVGIKSKGAHYRRPLNRPPKVAHRMKTTVSVIMMKKNFGMGQRGV
jgi:hypothetical protein